MRGINILKWIILVFILVCSSTLITWIIPNLDSFLFCQVQLPTCISIFLIFITTMILCFSSAGLLCYLGTKFFLSM